ncbi:MAG: hypothetical protein J0M04_21410 [Verrucomicrobia bacterium]|nr:hypothetical protein [Verrucomicrobiota bacterium]
MKTSALTVGAVALLSQGKALGDGVGGNNSSTIPQINPPYGAGVKRTEPTANNPVNSVVENFGLGQNYQFVTTVVSPCAENACKQFDEVKYVCKVEALISGSVTGLSVAHSRNFIAFQVLTADQNSSVIYSWEVTSQGSASIQPKKREFTSGGTILIDEDTYRLSIESERTACGANTVGVKARAVLKNLSTNVVTPLAWTPERLTVWQTCDSGQ